MREHHDAEEQVRINRQKPQELQTLPLQMKISTPPNSSMNEMNSQDQKFSLLGSMQIVSETFDALFFRFLFDDSDSDDGK